MRGRTARWTAGRRPGAGHWLVAAGGGGLLIVATLPLLGRCRAQPVTSSLHAR
jgi:hypothetical protein